MDLTEPRPFVGEHDTLLDFLRFYRAVVWRKASGLTHEQLNIAACPPSNLTLGGLIKHLACVEDAWLTTRFAATGDPEPWASAPWDQDGDWDLTSAKDDSPEELFALYEAACDRSDAILAERQDLDARMAQPNAQGEYFSLRWILVHLVEEYARHAGHADLLREAIDGATGDCT